MVKKAGSKKGRSASKAWLNQTAEDLDLHIDDADDINVSDYDEEDRIVHNKKSSRARADDLDVLPKEAYKLQGKDIDGGLEGGTAEEEAKLASLTKKKMAKRLADDDYAVPGLSLPSIKSDMAPSKAKLSKKGDAKSTGSNYNNASNNNNDDALDNALLLNPVERVHRDFNALTSEERLKLVQKESPELEAMLKEFNKSIVEAKTLSKALPSLLAKVKRLNAADKDGLSFLETKTQLLLNYCMNITFYLLLKVEGVQIKNHPVVERLVSVRTYLEKMTSLEKKLYHTLQRLLTSAGVADEPTAEGGDDDNNLAPNLTSLRPVVDANDSDVYKPSKVAGQNPYKEESEVRRAKAFLDEVDREELDGFMRVRSSKVKDALNVISRGEKSKKDGGAMGGLGDIAAEEEDHYFSKLVSSKDRKVGLKSNRNAEEEDPTDDDGDEDPEFDDEEGDEDEEEEYEEEDASGDSDEAESDDDDGAQEGDDSMMSRLLTLKKHQEALKKRKEAESKLLAEKNKRKKQQQYDDEEEEEEDDADDAAEEDLEGVYDNLQQDDGEHAGEDNNNGDSSLLDKVALGRRKISKAIMTHRGLTKSRSKDKKHARIANRIKFAKAENKAKAQSKRFRAEPAGGFSGVTSLKPTVIHSRKL